MKHVIQLPLLTETWLWSVLAGIVSNAGYDVIKTGVGRALDKIRYALKPDPWRNQKETPLTRACKSVASLVPQHDSKQAKDLVRALAAPEAHVLVSHIYEYREHLQVPVLESAKAAFIAYIAREVGNDAAGLASGIWDVLVETCNQALIDSLPYDGTRAIDQLAAFRHNLVRQDLAWIKQRLDAFAGLDQPTVNTIRDFEATYRGQVLTKHGTIMPTRFTESRRVPLDEVYVSPTFRSSNEVVSLADMMGNLKRAVVLGQPGGGKTTLAEKICVDLCTHYDRQPVAHKLLTPVLVLLRKFEEERRRSNCSLRDYIEQMADSHYQITPPKGAIDYLLSCGRLLVIFDGLDELVDTEDRQAIRDSIELFCNRYPHTTVLVTSRELGYSQAPLDRSFTVLHLNGFSPGQVREYVMKWFRNDLDLTSGERTATALAFLHDCESVDDLCRNPLMLALLCNIYRFGGYIPENRPLVYQKCAEMLFERWDRARHIFVPFSFMREVSPSVMFLAFWIASHQSRQNGVPESVLIARTADYLRSRFEEPDVAEQRARQFVEFCCKGRAWVLSDTGMRQDGEPLYQFTHRTFMEFFAASYVVRNYGSPQALLAFLSPKIVSQQWDVITQLAFHLLSERVEGGDDELLDGLLQRALKDNEHSLQYLSFAYRSLAFLSPSQAMLARLTDVCVTDSIDRLSTGRLVLPDLDLFGTLLSSSRSTRVFVARRIREALVREIHGHDENRALIALEIAFSLVTHDLCRDASLARFWEAVGDAILRETDRAIQHLTNGPELACWIAYNQGHLTIEKVIEGFTPSFIFHEYRSPRGCRVPPITCALLQSALWPANPRWHHTEMTSVASDLQFLGGLLPTVAPITVPSGLEYRSYVVPDRDAGRVPDLEPDALFGLFCLMAVVTEGLGDYYFMALDNNDETTHELLALLHARVRGLHGHTDPCQSPHRLQFSQHQQEVIGRWARHEFSFLTESR